MKDFRDLIAWQKSHQMTLAVYEETGSFPKHELYGLTSQVRRAAVSVSANITEGCGRGSNADFGRFLQMAMGSASELEYHLLLARDLGYLTPVPHEALTARVVEVKRILSALLRKVKEQP